MKVLIVDDESAIRRLLREYNEYIGNTVVEAANGEEAVALCKEVDFDIVLLDIMMPRMDGYEALEKIRKFSQIPVIMLSAKSEEYDKLRGFELGVDDYVVKPFSPKEVIARQIAIVQRESRTKKKAERFNGLEIDFSGREVIVDGQKATMTNKEYEVLFYLVKNKGIAISREKLLENVWDFAYEGDDRTIDTHIKMIREALGKYKEYIITVRGLGYKFES